MFFRLTTRDEFHLVLAHDRFTREWVPIAASVSVAAVSQFPMISRTRMVRARFVRGARRP